jgi:parallel beta-helix repeat protein
LPTRLEFWFATAPEIEIRLRTETGSVYFGSRHVRILASAFRRNALGMHIEDSTRIRIKGSVISRNENAIALEADGNEVRRNRVSRNGNGIGIEGNRNLVRGNRVVRTSGAGGFGIALAQGDDNVIARNSVRGSEMVAISVGFEPGAGNVVRRNRIRGAGKAGVLVDSKGVRTLLVGNVVRAVAKDGILVKSTAEQTVLSRNRSFGAQDDGIDVNSASTRLSENTASRNNDLGIEAVPGVSDGGQNRASGNGNPVQCVNVFCSSG